MDPGTSYKMDKALHLATFSGVTTGLRIHSKPDKNQSKLTVCSGAQGSNINLKYTHFSTKIECPSLCHSKKIFWSKTAFLLCLIPQKF